MAMICVSGGKGCDGCLECRYSVGYPVCPVCGAETDTFHINERNDVVGCENCVYSVDAWEVVSFRA